MSVCTFDCEVHGPHHRCPEHGFKVMSHADKLHNAHMKTAASLLQSMADITQLRADLVSVTAERQELLIAERVAHAETRAALEREQAEHCWEDCCCRESTRAELARSEARVKELETAAKAHLLAGEALLNAAGMEKFSG